MCINVTVTVPPKTIRPLDRCRIRRKGFLIFGGKRKIYWIEIQIVYETSWNVKESPIIVFVGLCRKVTVTVPVSV